MCLAKSVGRSRRAQPEPDPLSRCGPPPSPRGSPRRSPRRSPRGSPRGPTPARICQILRPGPGAGRPSSALSSWLRFEIVYFVLFLIGCVRVVLGYREAASGASSSIRSPPPHVLPERDTCVTTDGRYRPIQCSIMNGYRIVLNAFF